MISLAGGLPDPHLFPTAELAAISHRVITEQGQHVLQYGVTKGDAEVCRTLGRLFSAETDVDGLVVTTGSQQALDLIARVLVNPGDQVVLGDPDYLGALQVFRGYGGDVHPIGVDAEGLNTVQLEEELRWGLRPTCCYIVPNFHNPTGVTMSVERREHLNQLSQHYGFLVIEDDPYRELYYSAAPPNEHAGDPELTVQLRSASKMLAPGLRIGALSGPQWLTQPIITAKQSVDLHTSSLTQAIVAEALTAPWLDAHLDGLRQAYSVKRDALIAGLRSSFGASVDVDTPAGGMFLWARFPEIDRCLAMGVCFVPGQAFGVRRDLSKYARLSFATGTPHELGEAATRMKSAANFPG